MWAILMACGVGSVALLASAWPGRAERLPAMVVWAAVGAGALAAVIADAEPTGWVPLDTVLRAGLGATVPLAAARAGQLPSIWLSCVAAAAGVVAGGWPAGLAGFWLGVLVGGVAAGERSAALRAASSAGAVAALAHLGDGLRLGLPSVATLVAVFPVLLVGWWRSSPVARARIGRVAGAACLVAVVGAAGGAYAAFQARTAVDDAVEAAVAGLDLIGGDERQLAVARLDSAAAEFSTAEATLRAWWARPALLVPAVAQQSRAVSTMAAAGRDLASAASSAVLAADVDSVRPINGVVDLVAVKALRPPLRAAVESLRRADGRLSGVASPLLLPAVADRLTDLRLRVTEALERAQTAAAAVEVAPGMLGADGPRRYLLALQTPAELRGSGGFMGSWAELQVDAGRFDLTRTGRVRELTRGGSDPTGRRIEGQPAYVARYGQAPAQYWGLIGFSPDFPTVGAVMAQLYPESGGAPVDGVIAVDPTAFAAFLGLTGPIEVPGFPQRLSQGDAERTLLFDQYLAFPGAAADEREQFLADATEVLFDRLTGGELPGPRAIAAELGPAVEGRHLQLFSTHAQEQRFFERIGATGSVQRSDGDVVGLVAQNYSGNKIDWFQRRTLSYDLRWDPATGVVTGTLEAHITNTAPASGLPRSIISWGGDLSLGQAPVADGESFMELSVFSAFPLEEVTLDGTAAPMSRTEHLGMHETWSYVRVPAGSTVVLRAGVRGRVDVGDEYVLRLLQQPTVVPDEVEVRIELAPGWTPASVTGGEPGRGGAQARWRADRSHELRLRATRVGGDALIDWFRGAG